MIRYITQDEVYSNIDILKTKTITTTCYSSCTIIYHLLVYGSKPEIASAMGIYFLTSWRLLPPTTMHCSQRTY